MKRLSARAEGQAIYIAAILIVFLAVLITKAIEPALNVQELGSGIIITGLFALMSGTGGTRSEAQAPPPVAPAPVDLSPLPSAAGAAPIAAPPANAATPAQRQAQANG